MKNTTEQTTKKEQVVLTFQSIACEGFNVRSNFDRRERVNQILANMCGSDGETYRRMFEFDRTKYPTFDSMYSAMPVKVNRNIGMTITIL
jgi:hypothetical protein